MKTKPPAAQDKISAVGLEAICGMIANTHTLTQIAAEIGVSIGSLLTWAEAETTRSARIREARQLTARMWDEKATQGIEDAEDAFELAKAKEIAHHYRWRASKIAPREYGDKVALTGADEGPIQFTNIVRKIVKPDE